MNLRKNELVSLYERLSQGYNKGFLNQILRPSGRGGVFAARDYISANAVLAEIEKEVEKGVRVDRASINSREDLKKILHTTTRFRLAFYTPMLAERYDGLKPAEQKRVWEDRNFIFTCKENGVRGVFVYAAGRTCLFSRNYSQVDCRLPEYWGNVAQEFKGDRAFAIDCEVKFEPDSNVKEELEEFGLSTDSKLEAMSALLQMEPSASIALQKEYERTHGKPLIVFRLITTLYYNGVDYRKRTLGEAYKVEKEVLDYAQKRGLNVVPIKKMSGTRSEKEAFLTALIDAGEEGTVVHNLQSRYITSENRAHDGFIKIKRSVKDTLRKQGLGDTIDCFITGFTMSKDGTADEGLIGSYECSIYLQRPDGTRYKHVAAYVPNIPREEKIQFTSKDESGKPCLDPMMYGMVIEVDGQEVSRVSKRLTHPRMLLKRFEKTEEDCVYLESFWESQMDVKLDESNKLR